MAKLEQLGKVIETDILVIGGGVSGLSTAICAKEAHPKLNVAIVERRVIGKAGLAPKAGHGSLYLLEELGHTPEKFVEDRVIRSGEYLNDQDMLRQMAEKINYTIEKAESWGVPYAHNEDGSYQAFDVPVGPWGDIALPLGISEILRQKAASLGVEMYNRIQIVDLIKDNDRISAALGMQLENMANFIFRAKSYVLCTQACDFGGQQMFNGMGEGIAMAYHAGAEMRNCEFGISSDLVAKNDGHPIYGGHLVICNAKGENISMKYAPDAYEVSNALLLGMEKEMEMGNGPLYADLRVATEQLKAIGFMGNPDDKPGFVDGKRRIWDDALEFHAKIGEKAEKYRVISDEDPAMPLVTAKFAPYSSPIRTDKNFKTTLPNLWAAGATCTMGSAHIGWCRGDGVSGMIRTGFFAGPSAAEGAKDAELAPVDPVAVEQAIAKFKAPMQNEGGLDPYEVLREMVDFVFDPKYMLHRTEESLTEALNIIDGFKEKVTKMYANDGHMLMKCHQISSMLLNAELMFRAGLMRKESRGGTWRHHRDDYPETDNKNWLKWIIVAKRGGKMKLWTEDVPIEKYKYKPTDM